MEDQFPTCSKCGKVFEHVSSKSRHQKNCKKGPDVLKVKKTYNCPNVEWCEQVFNKISNYNRHIKNCKVKTTQSHSCMQCGKDFTKPSHLLRHQKVHNKKVFTCTRCFTCFVREDKFKAHNEKCATTQSAVDYMPSMVTGDIVDRDICWNPEVEDGVEKEPCFLVQQVQPQFSVIDEVPNLDDDAEDCNSDSDDHSDHNSTDRGQQMNNSINNEPPTCSSSFIDAFHNGINNDDSISTETPSVYIVDEDNDYHDMFENMDFVLPDSPPAYAKYEFESDVAACMVSHLKLLKLRGKKSNVKKQEFAKLCLLLYKKVDDIDFMNALATELGFLSREELLDFINSNIANESHGPGRPMSGVVKRQKAYDFWKERSDISNDQTLDTW